MAELMEYRCKELEGFMEFCDERSELRYEK